jgi:hypothetical protein
MQILSDPPEYSFQILALVSKDIRRAFTTFAQGRFLPTWKTTLFKATDLEIREGIKEDCYSVEKSSLLLETMGTFLYIKVVHWLCSFLTREPNFYKHTLKYYKTEI